MVAYAENTQSSSCASDAEYTAGDGSTLCCPAGGAVAGNGSVCASTAGIAVCALRAAAVVPSLGPVVSDSEANPLSNYTELPADEQCPTRMPGGKHSLSVPVSQAGKDECIRGSCVGPSSAVW